MPILSHVLLEAWKGTPLHVSANDLDVSVSSDHACEVLKDGKVAVEGAPPRRRAGTTRAQE